MCTKIERWSNQTTKQKDLGYNIMDHTSEGNMAARIFNKKD